MSKRRISQRRDGYRLVYAPKHPRAPVRGYIYEHRLVAEAKLGRLLSANEIVHHVNGDRGDNRPENLEVVTKAWHQVHHMATRPDLSDADVLALIQDGWTYSRLAAIGVYQHRTRRIRREAGL